MIENITNISPIIKTNTKLCQEESESSLTSQPNVRLWQNLSVEILEIYLIFTRFIITCEISKPTAVKKKTAAEELVAQKITCIKICKQLSTFYFQAFSLQKIKGIIVKIISGDGTSTYSEITHKEIHNLIRVVQAHLNLNEIYRTEILFFMLSRISIIFLFYLKDWEFEKLSIEMLH